MQIGIELYRGSADCRQGLQLDIAYTIQRLFETFPGIVFEEEYFEQHIELVRRITADKANKGALNIAIRDAKERGPLFEFIVRSPEGAPLKGGISRYCLAFRFDNNTIGPELKAKVEQFLASFSINRFQNELTESSNHESK